MADLKQLGNLGKQALLDPQKTDTHFYIKV